MVNTEEFNKWFTRQFRFEAAALLRGSHITEADTDRIMQRIIAANTKDDETDLDAVAAEVLADAHNPEACKPSWQRCTSSHCNRCHGKGWKFAICEECGGNGKAKPLGPSSNPAVQ